jgi:cephalosporin hydroxylase
MSFEATRGGSLAQPFMEDSLDWPLHRVLPILQQRIMQGSTYHGIPTLKCPLDFWIYHEILWETKPEVIIEIGNYFGGSTLALAHACDAIGTGKVIGVDTTHEKIHPRVKAHPRITLVTGDAAGLRPVVERMLEGNRNVMVIEDSAHTYENTFNVLTSYSPLIGTGKYFIVEDGICHHGLEVGPKPGPYEAVEAFVSADSSFVIDRSREAYCITWNPKGYLRKIGSS